MKKLIILGAGGYGQTVADVAEQFGYGVFLCQTAVWLHEGSVRKSDHIL